MIFKKNCSIIVTEWSTSGVEALDVGQAVF